MTMKDWSRRIGEQHGQRDRAATLGAQALVQVEHERHERCLQRWPTIIAAMRTVVASYNDGAGHQAITLAEDGANPGVTLESAANGRRALIIALDGSDVSVRTRNGHGDVTTGLRWVSLNRTDEDAAAYLLRDWFERL
jgi:hypothetical protein